jgi:hypothetical protein
MKESTLVLWLRHLFDSASNINSQRQLYCMIQSISQLCICKILFHCYEAGAIVMSHSNPIRPILASKLISRAETEKPPDVAN